MKKLLIIGLMVASVPVMARDIGTAAEGRGQDGRGQGQHQWGGGEAPVGGRGGGDVARPQRGGGGGRGTAGATRGEVSNRRAATMGAVVGVHSGLNRLHQEHCERMPGIATNVLSRTQGHCAPEALAPMSGEQALEILGTTAIAPEMGPGPVFDQTPMEAEPIVEINW